MKKTNLLLIFMLLHFAFACQKKEPGYLEEWKADKKACSGIRTVEKTQALIKELKIENHSLESIITTLGNPDELSKSNEATYLEYYVENNCSTEEKDVCLLTITFFNGQNKPKSYITCT